MIDWVYTIDIDQNVFRVCETVEEPFEPGTVGTQYFRLDNIPRHLFKEEIVGSSDLMMRVSVPAIYLATHLDRFPQPDRGLLALYDSFAPPPQATFSLPSGDRMSTWHRLQLELIQQFVQYFRLSFCDSCPSRYSSPFVFRQMAYAVLCLTSRAGLKFHRCTATYLLDADSIDPRVRTPTWEPPETDTYWLGDVLIVLDQDLSVSSPSANTKASIARAVQLAPATPTTAVILSVNAIILVHIAPGQPITHTARLPLLTLGPSAHPFTPQAIASLQSVSYATPGVLALLDLFNTHPRIPRFAAVSPARLPVELCRMVFHAADEPTQDALEASCRIFRAAAGEYPRIGELTLDTWGPHDKVKLGALYEGGDGWQVGLWGMEKVEINMPVVRIRRERSVRCEDLGIYLD